MNVVVFSMGERGHFRRMLAVIDGLRLAGATPYVFTDAGFEREVIRAGGRFVNLFARHTLDDADKTSIPVPSRFVTFAGLFAEPVIEAARHLRPALVVHDTFAVIGHVVANHLGVPRVNVCAGHNFPPGAAVETLQRDPRVAIDPVCLEAVERLRTHHRIPDASPFAYVTGVSPDLNLYCEPPEYLTDAEREPFEPIAFFGSLPREAYITPALSPRDVAPDIRVYASFGTVIWRYYRAQATAALGAIVSAIRGRSDASLRVSLGGADVPEAARWTGPNVRVDAYTDQWRALRESTVFITHQGLNSTHEAVWHEVPMISYPFLNDQPGLSRRAIEFDIAVPLSNTPRAAIVPMNVTEALDRVRTRQSVMRRALIRARAWESDIMRERPAVIERILSLAERDDRSRTRTSMSSI